MSLLTEVTVVVSIDASEDLRVALTQPVLPEDRDSSDPHARPWNRLNQIGPDRLQAVNTSYAGGGKVYCSHLFAAMFNYVAPGRVVEFLDGLDWGHSTAVVVIDSEESWDDHDTDEQVVLTYPRKQDR